MLWKVPPLEENQAVVMEEVTDPVEVARARAQRERFDRNWKWFREHLLELGKTHRGKYVAIAGEQAFVADTLDEAAALARSAHPDDDGRFTYFIPKERVALP
jgi:hypothetical protein